MSALKSRLGTLVDRTYFAVYAFICGSDPHQRPWHFQWLPARILRRDLRRALRECEGDVLDVGCGTRPYETWIPRRRRFVGADVTPGSGVDFVITPGESWPIAGNAFDVVLCTQVLEHVREPDATLREAHRVLRPGGRLVITTPFIYGRHGGPHDYRRLTVEGLEALLPRGFHVEETARQGGIGSSAGTLVLGWMNMTMTRTRPRLLVALLAMPAWILLAAMINAVALAFDRIDRTRSFYGNVLVIAAKT